MSVHVDTTHWVKGKNYPEWFDQIGLDIVSNGYLLPEEDVFKAFLRNFILNTDQAPF
jgi:hypothetical protein